MKNCSTTRRISNFKQFNLLSKTFFAQFQRKVMEIDIEHPAKNYLNEELWPVVPALNEFLLSTKTIKARKTYPLVN
jgi:hypothetical protein